MMSPVAAWVVSSESTSLDILLFNFGGHRSCGSEDTKIGYYFMVRIFIVMLFHDFYSCYDEWNETTMLL